VLLIAALCRNLGLVHDQRIREIRDPNAGDSLNRRGAKIIIECCPGSSPVFENHGPFFEKSRRYDLIYFLSTSKGGGRLSDAVQVLVRRMLKLFALLVANRRAHPFKDT
jgi:hypothetical protein